MENKKGTGQNPAPKGKHNKYNRLQSLCIGISTITIIIFMIAYFRGNDRVVLVTIGMMAVAMILQLFINIEEEQDD